jgi:hypothetical protein
MSSSYVKFNICVLCWLEGDPGKICAYGAGTPAKAALAGQGRSPVMRLRGENAWRRQSGGFWAL